MEILLVSALAVLSGAALVAAMAVYNAWKSSPGFINTIRSINSLTDIIVNFLASKPSEWLAPKTSEDAYTTAQRAKGEARAAALEQISTYTHTQFATAEAVDAGYAEFLTLYRAGVITLDDFTVVAKFDLAEKDRILAAAISPPAPVPGVPGVTPVTVNVAAPTVNVAAPSVHVDAPDISGALTPLTLALPLVGATAITNLLASAKTWGHDVATGQRGCWQTTFVDMLGSLVRPASTLAMLNLPEQWSPLKLAMNKIVDGTFARIFDSPSLQQPVTPEKAPAIAKDLFKQALELGVDAQLISITCEMFQPAKMLGFGYLAAFLSDMAGFAKIGGAMMGVIETQALARPFGYYTNAKVRSVLPGIREAGELLGQRQISQEKYRQLLGYNGLSPEFEAGYEQVSYRAATYFMLRAVADSGTYDEAYFKAQLQQATYDEATVPRMLDMLKRMSQGDLKALFTSSALSRYRDGQDDAVQLATNLTALGVRDELLPKYQLGADLSRDHDRWLDEQKAAKEKPKELQPVMLSTAISRYKEGLDNEEQFTTNLTFLGIDARLLPRYVYAANLERDYDDMMDYITELKAAVTKGAIEPPDMQQLLIAEGMDAAKAAGYARLAALGLLKAPPKV